MRRVVGIVNFRLSPLTPTVTSAMLGYRLLTEASAFDCNTLF